jgi:hypothetical protein
MNYNNFNQLFIYQLNTRIFCIEHGQKILRTPEKFFTSPEVIAADAVWLMGVWFPSSTSVNICKMHEGLGDEFRKTLPDLQSYDLIGSPYAVYDYKPNPMIAEHILELKQFRYKLNAIGKKLILDFVPNHMAVDSPLVKQYPDLFLYKKEEDAEVCKNSFLHKNGRIYYYGRDPYYDGWTDTVQWDFSHPQTVKLHAKILSEIVDACDGLRCDMAMLPLEDVFERTHGIRALPYWKELIEGIKESRPDFLFIAEVYWNREHDLQQLGFDYTYDKTLYDRLKNRDAEGVRLHLEAAEDYQNHSLRFIENHDEPRAASIFGEFSISNFALLCFLPGCILYHQGQREGRKIKIPVQLARLANETPDSLYESFYDRAFSVIQERQGRELELEIFALKSYGEEDSLRDCIVRAVFSSEHKYIEILILNTYSHEIMGALHLPESIRKILMDSNLREIDLLDITSGEMYSREKKVLERGMFIRLDAGKAHWFLMELEE